MIDHDLVDALTSDLIGALDRQAVAEGVERRASGVLAEAEEALEASGGDGRHRLARDRAEGAWRAAAVGLEDEREDREAIEAELEAMDPAAVRFARLRHGPPGAAGDRRGHVVDDPLDDLGALNAPARRGGVLAP